MSSGPYIESGAVPSNEKLVPFYCEQIKKTSLYTIESVSKRLYVLNCYLFHYH